MNREIKFRGMDLKGNWHYGNLAVIPDKPRFKHPPEPGSYISNSVGMPFAYPVRPETVGEYTGLKDKNGKEIYEGDIFHVAGNHKYTVKFFEESECNFEKSYASFCLTIPERMTFPIDEWALQNGQVIGNIYETPELFQIFTNNK